MKNKIKISFFLAGLIVVAIICFGAVFYKTSENLSWVDAFLSTSLLLTTAGSGSISNESSKIFSIVYVLVGIPTVLFCLGYIVETILEQKIKNVEKKVNEIMLKEDKILAEEKLIEKEQD